MIMVMLRVMVMVRMVSSIWEKMLIGNINIIGMVRVGWWVASGKGSMQLDKV